MEEIEQIGIDRVYLAGAKVAQEVVDGRDRILPVRATAEVFDGEAFTSVRVG